MTDTKKINIGCGEIHHPDWINLDVSSDDPSVLLLDVTRGLPFENSSIDVCYSSHVLEHLDRNAATAFVKESFRVLRSGGVIRLAVPDLEQIAREYLRLLEVADSEKHVDLSDYDWIMLELYDQVARIKPGGEMAAFLHDLPKDQRIYVRARIGVEANRIWDEALSVKKGSPNQRSIRWRALLTRWRLNLASAMVRVISGKSGLESFKKGIFRDSGEVHKWMYDRYSLKQLLEKAGFVDIKRCDANESRIVDFEKYALDVKDGVVRKPDSLFIEASKP